MSAPLSSPRPHLVRALYSWILENDGAPQIVVDITDPGVQMPPRAVARDGRIAFNLAPRAVRDLDMDGGDRLSFNARFQGTPGHVSVPFDAILAIHCSVHGHGMAFAAPEDGGGANDAGDTNDKPGPDKPDKPPVMRKLRRVK